MDNIKNIFSEKKFKLHPLVITFIVIAILGLIDASYLTIKHYGGGSISCSAFEGCDVVASSEYSVLFGIIPLSLLGVLYYLSAIFLGFLYGFLRERIILKLIVFLASLALLSSIYFTYLQFFVIEAICIYCLFSALTSTLLFILSLVMLKKFPVSTEEELEAHI